MMDQSTIYPNLSWQQFAVFNDNATDAFEDMCRDSFCYALTVSGKTALSSM